MRNWLVTACVLAGCLRGSTDVAEPKVSARDAWKTYFVSGQYVQAAKIAWQNKLGPFLIGLSLRKVRKDVKFRVDHYYGDYSADNETLKERLRQAFRKEVEIACVYGPTKASATLAINDVRRARDLLNEDLLLNLLLDYDCPLDHAVRYDIITTAAKDGTLDDYALIQALKADLSLAERIAFSDLYVASNDCTWGFKAAARLAVTPHEIENLIHESSCEQEPIAPADWGISQSDARGYFFVAVGARKYNLALAFNEAAVGGADGTWYVVQEMFAQRDEYQTAALVTLRPELRDIIYGYAIDHGRARFVGMQTKEVIWEQRAYDALIAAGKYDDAAEVAEFGPSLTMRTEGVLKAFRAAAAAGDYVMARYLWKRYPKIVPTKEAERARLAWNKTHPKDKRFRGPRKLPKKPLDPDCVPSASGDWTIKRCQ